MPTTDTARTEAVLREEIDRLREDVTVLRDNLTNLTKDAARAAKAGMFEAKSHLSDAAHTAADKGKQAAHAIEQKVEDNPLVSIGIAFGVGLLVGALLRGRN